MLAFFCGVLKAEDRYRLQSAKIISFLCKNTEEKTMNILKKLLPLPIINYILKDASNAINYFEEFHETPEIIWNDKMKTELKNFIQKELNE